MSRRAPVERCRTRKIDPAGGFHDAVGEAKRTIIREALRAEEGHQTRAAKRLGLTQPYLARLIKNLQIR